MFVYLAAVDGQIEVHVEQEVVGSARSATGLAQVFARNGVDGSADIYCSSTIDFADEEGFESGDQAREMIEDALDLVA